MLIYLRTPGSAPIPVVCAYRTWPHRFYTPNLSEDKTWSLPLGISQHAAQYNQDASGLRSEG